MLQHHGFLFFKRGFLIGKCCWRSWLQGRLLSKVNYLAWEQLKELSNQNPRKNPEEENGNEMASGMTAGLSSLKQLPRVIVFDRKEDEDDVKRSRKGTTDEWILFKWSFHFNWNEGRGREEKRREHNKFRIDNNQSSIRGYTYRFHGTAV